MIYRGIILGRGCLGVLDRVLNYQFFAMMLLPMGFSGFLVLVGCRTVARDERRFRFWSSRPIVIFPLELFAWWNFCVEGVNAPSNDRRYLFGFYKQPQKFRV